MIRPFLNVLRIVRPRHFLKALLHPLEELQAFKYHYRRVPEREFVAFLARPGADASDRLDSVWADLERHRTFQEDLRSKLAVHAEGYGGQMTREASAIYALVRLLKPETLLETGVADGTTSAFILRALEDNGTGRLHSIDLPSAELPAGRPPGWIVGPELRHRWDLRIGPAQELLAPLLTESGPIDFFLHDSLHTYEHMMFEFEAAWPSLRPGGLFLSHDVGRHAAFFDFAARVGMRWRDWRVFHVLGGFRKP